MTHDVANVSLIPNFETPNEGTVSVQVMTKGICRTPFTPMPLRLDPSTRSGIVNAPGKHVTDLVYVACETHSGEPTAIETGTVMLDVLHHMVWWRVATVINENRVSHAACQSPK